MAMLSKLFGAKFSGSLLVLECNLPFGTSDSVSSSSSSLSLSPLRCAKGLLLSPKRFAPPNIAAPPLGASFLVADNLAFLAAKVFIVFANCCISFGFSLGLGFFLLLIIYHKLYYQTH